MKSIGPPKRKSVVPAIGALIFDIETIPQDEKRLLALMPTFEPDSRLKDPEKIAANLEMQKQKYIERAALSWHTAEIALIGFSDGKDFSCLCGTEAENLNTFFQIMEQFLNREWMVGGHNIKNFDLPMMINRARVLKVSIPSIILGWRNGRPQWHEKIFDTLEMISFGDKQKIEGNGVEDVARTLGLPAKLGDGSQFPSLWKSDKAAAKVYNRRDVEVEIGIAKYCGIKFL